MGFHAVRKKRVHEIMLAEYDPWVKSLSRKEVHAIKKYTKNTFDDDRPKFYERLNAMLRGDLPEDSKLREYADTISGALRRKPLEHDVICFRRVNVNPFEGMSVGQEKIIPQFFSTSISKRGAIKGEYEIVLFVRKGARGAFLDERVSRMPNQLELLIDKDVKYRIMNIDGSNITVEVIPDETV